MAAAAGLLRASVGLAAASSLHRPGLELRRVGAAAAAVAFFSVRRRYGSEAREEEEELRVRYLDDEHKGNGGQGKGFRSPSSILTQGDQDAPPPPPRGDCAAV